MTDASTAAERRASSADMPRGGADIIDAEFEDIGAAGHPHLQREKKPHHPPYGHRHPADTADPAHMATLRRDGAHVLAKPDRGGIAFWSMGLLLVLGAFWFSGGYSMVLSTPLGILPASDPAAPQDAQQAFPSEQLPLSPLHLANVSTDIQDHGGREIILVDGAVVNDGDKSLAIPPIAIEVTDRNRVVTRYFLGTNGRVLAPRERYAFSSRLIAPKNGAESVKVRFSSEGG